jgi:3-methyladenine DNA glycosylase Tag
MLPPKPSPEALLHLSDDRVLAEMTKRVFSAGFAWSVIESKWPGFEEAFLGLEPSRLTFQPDEFWDGLTKDSRIVRNGPKIASVRLNARFVLEVAKERGSFGKFLAAWPSSDEIGLLEALAERGSRLGGNTGQTLLRFLGWDGFVASKDVVACLRDSGLDVAADVKSKRDLAKIQAQFNAWAKETGSPYVHLSHLRIFDRRKRSGIAASQSPSSPRPRRGDCSLARPAGLASTRCSMWGVVGDSYAIFVHPFGVGRRNRHHECAERDEGRGGPVEAGQGRRRPHEGPAMVTIQGTLPGLSCLPRISIRLHVVRQRMKRRLISSLTIAIIFSAPVRAEEAPNSSGFYAVSPGSIGGVPATLLLDRATGKTWYLGEVDSQGKVALPAASSGSPIWVPIPFVSAPPKTPPR